MAAKPQMISRSTVHAWSEAIGEANQTEQANLTRLMKDQRRLSRFVEENMESLAPETRSVALYLVAVVARIYEKAGGRLKIATWEQVRAATIRVERTLGSVLPYDEAFVMRCRGVAGRRQPHVVDEALYALFERAPRAEEAPMPATERVKILLLMWVANEVCAENWSPPPGFVGDTTYTFTPVEP